MSNVDESPSLQLFRTCLGKILNSMMSTYVYLTYIFIYKHANLENKYKYI